MKRLNQIMRDERGVTALETAIILIAFVVVAAVFAFTMLTTGTFLTERSKEAALAGVSQVRGSLEVRGSVYISDVNPSDTSCNASSVNTAKNVVFTLSNVAGGTPVDLTDTAGKQVTTFTYKDKWQAVDLNAKTGGTQMWTVRFVGKKTDNSQYILNPGEQAEITVNLTNANLSCELGPNHTFSIEIKPPNGAVLSLERTTPAQLDSITDMH